MIALVVAAGLLLYLIALAVIVFFVRACSLADSDPGVTSQRKYEVTHR